MINPDIQYMNFFLMPAQPNKFIEINTYAYMISLFVQLLLYIWQNTDTLRVQDVLPVKNKKIFQ